MRRACLHAAAVLLFFAFPAVLARSQGPPEQLARLTTATSLDTAGLKPWHMRMSFRLLDLDGKPEDAGTLDAWWEENEGSRVLVDSPALHGALPSPHEAFALGKGREVYLLRELLAQVVHPVPVYRDFTKLRLDTLSRTFGKVTLQCLRLNRVNNHAEDESPGTAPEFCSQPGDDTMLRIRFDQGHLSITRNRPAKSQGINIAFDNDLSYNAKLAISGHVESLETVDATTIPAGAAREPGTVEMQSIVLAGRKTGGDNPHYPQFDRDKGIMGSVVLFVLIDKTGHVTEMVPIASRDLQLTGAATEAIKTWTYKPMLINERPVDVNTTITVNFNLNPRTQLF